MDTGTCEPRYRDFDRMPQHQQLTYFYKFMFVFIDWSIVFYRMFNLLKSITWFRCYAMSKTYAPMDTGTCEPRYRDFDRMPQHQQLTYFYKFMFVFIDWSIVFYRMFNFLKSITWFRCYAMSKTYAPMDTGTCEPRYRDFDRMPQHQQLTYFYKLYFVHRLEYCLF